ncbi:MAG: hypothetical protein WBD27_00855 [Pyrinomonadaceae bacterium]
MTSLKTIAAIFVAASTVLLTSCSVFRANEDCGFSASFDLTNGKTEIEIIFSRVLAEELNGTRNCGFAYVQTRVENAMIDGTSLAESVRDEKYVYTAAARFDPRKDPRSIESGGKGYISDFESVQQVDRRAFIKLRPFPPK